MGLREYRKKRNFRQTAEPAGGPKHAVSERRQFVVQKHAASHLHYDFRLEMEGVLKSWAVPKGFPFSKGERRLAVRVEDHPLDYANFEGVISPGNYGAGTVMIWDQGHYQVEAGDPVRGLEHGKLHLTLTGQKLKGDWTLVRMRQDPNAAREQWLLFKSGQDAPPLSARADDRSVLTGRSLKRIAEDKDAEWQSNRPAAHTTNRSSVHSSHTATASPATDDADLTADLRQMPKARPHFVDPMKALLVRELPKGPDWVYEVKFDGFRALAIKDRQQVSLISRNAKEFTERYPRIVEALREFPADQAVLDGEIVAIDPEGRSSFQLLQTYLDPAKKKPPLLYYVFDILNLEGRDLSGLPLSRRKALLQSRLEDMPQTVRFSAALEDRSNRLVREMKKRGLEGVIAKRRDSKYEAGQRTGSWSKFKWTNEQEFVIGGYTPPKGTRDYFGAILVGFYQSGQLRFASKVGSGFDFKRLETLFGNFQQLRQFQCPFVNLPETVPGGLRAAEMRSCTWLKPELVCQIRFTEWTRDGHLRHPVFLGLRDDKKAREVTREA